MVYILAYTSFQSRKNVFIGGEDPTDDKCFNITKLILNAFKFRPVFIGQDMTHNNN